MQGALVSPGLDQANLSSLSSFPVRFYSLSLYLPLHFHHHSLQSFFLFSLSLVTSIIIFKLLILFIFNQYSSQDPLFLSDHSYILVDLMVMRRRSVIVLIIIIGLMIKFICFIQVIFSLPLHPINSSSSFHGLLLSFNGGPLWIQVKPLLMTNG